MPRRIQLAKFNREYHTHEMFGESFAEAMEQFAEDVMLWQAQTGVQFKVEMVSTRNEWLMCNVTGIEAVFETDEDYALYRLYMPDHKMATTIKHMDNKWQFAGWRTKNITCDA